MGLAWNRSEGTVRGKSWRTRRARTQARAGPEGFSCRGGGLSALKLNVGPSQGLGCPAAGGELGPAWVRNRFPGQGCRWMALWHPPGAFGGQHRAAPPPETGGGRVRARRRELFAGAPAVPQRPGGERGLRGHRAPQRLRQRQQARPPSAHTPASSPAQAGGPDTHTPPQGPRPPRCQAHRGGSLCGEARVLGKRGFWPTGSSHQSHGGGSGLSKVRSAAWRLHS